MVNEIYSLYKECLPDINRSEETVKRILGDTGNHIINYMVAGKLAGVSVINDNTILLLCVEKSFQNRGVGGELLKQSEEYILSNGFHKFVAGAGKDYIMPGIPMNNGAHNFFKKRGYIHSWGNRGCFDMCQMLKDFDYNEHSIGDVIAGITYRRALIHDVDNIVKCVSDAEESFVQYYQNEEVYEKGANPLVLIAEKDNEVLGALMVDIETGNTDTGSIGCTATACQHRNKGIATNMVILGTKYLKDIGLSKVYLSYTYTDIVSMYGRAGYKVCMEYYMGEKSVENTLT
ncbi:MAG: GNAT family N-acetyltransferase [Oscillospiraceae bacterium]|jgi:ribosomal protein S18 acetylase RimI-like enzyme|nr:GNAT family N-acetyltransferase [Oscillospiraceae bacterium]